MKIVDWIAELAENINLEVNAPDEATRRHYRALALGSLDGLAKIVPPHEAHRLAGSLRLEALGERQAAAEAAYREVYFANIDHRDPEGRNDPLDHPAVAEASRAQSAAQAATARAYLAQN